MKFTKTAVAVVIAGIAAAPMIASADTTLSGAVEIKIQGTDEEEATDGTDPGAMNIGTGDVLLGIVSEHELDNGLTGYGSLRVDLNTLSGGGVEDADNVYVGIKGGFGDIRIGETPVVAEYGQVANDIHDLTGSVNGGISYTGAFGPVSLGLGFSPEANEDVMAAGVKFSLGGFAIGLGGEDRGGDINASAGASFALAGASIAAHYWVQQPDGNEGDDPTAMAVKVGYGFGGVSAAVTYSQADNLVDDYETKIRLDLGYGLGGGLTLSSRITASQDNSTTVAVDDLTEWRVMLSKSF